MKSSDILGWFKGLAVLFTQDKQILLNQEKIMADLKNLTATVDRLAGDFTSLDTDVRAYITAHPPVDPAEQAKVDGITTRLGAIADGLEGLDTAAKATPPVPPAVDPNQP